MAEAVVDLWNDLTNNRMVKSFTSTEAYKLNEAGLYQDSAIRLRWRPLQPLNLFSATPYANVPIAGLTIDVAIGPRAGVESILARQLVWTPNAGGNYLEAVLDLNTTEMATAIATADTLSSYFEIKMTESGKTRPVYQERVDITAVVIGPSGAANLPSAASGYYTVAQIDALLKGFVKFTGNPAGSTIELPSPDASATRILGCNDDATSQDEILQ